MCLTVLRLFCIFFCPFTEAESSLPVCNGQSGTSFFNHSNEEAASPDKQSGDASKEPALLRELDADLLQSGKLKLTGKLL